MPDFSGPLGLKALRQGYAKGDFTPVEIAKIALDRAEGPLAELNGLSSLDRDMTMAEAEASTHRWREGKTLSALDGAFISFKDSFHIKGLPRWHGTACHLGTLSSYDALPVKHARAAGMIVTCKTTMPDFAMLMSGLSSQHGVIGNAWNRDDSPGGSSSGAPSSVVLGAATVALGTDMVGSVRLPAALSGLASIKPTQGRIAYDPAGSFRSAGPMAASVAEVSLTLEALGRFSDGDHFSAEGAFEPKPDSGIKGKKIALWRNANWGDAVDADTRSALAKAADLLADQGANIVEVSPPLTPADYMAIHWNMLLIGASDYFTLPEDRRKRIHPAIGEMYHSLIDKGAIFAAEMQHNLLVATARFTKALDAFDFVLSPALPQRRFSAELPCPTPELGAASHQTFACWFNQAGWPAATLPILDLKDGGVPISIQIAGKRFCDADVLNLAKRLEEARGFDVTFPKVEK